MEFKHFLGNEKIKAQLSALVDGGRLPHAVVLEGESGLGKRTLAGELAAALVCRGEHRPCDSCPQCHVPGCTRIFWSMPRRGAPVRFTKRRWIKLWAMCI